MSSTASKRQQLWVCWQEPETDRGKFSLIPSSWIAKVITGDGASPGSLILLRWPRSEELFTAKVIHDPTPNDLAQVEIMEIPMFMDGNADQSDTNGIRKSARNQQANQQSKSYNAASNGPNEDGQFVVSQLKRFFLCEMSKISGEMQANFDILGHRIGALEVNMKCVRERVERIENVLNNAVTELDAPERNPGFLGMQSRLDSDDHEPVGRRVKSEQTSPSKRGSTNHDMALHMGMNMDEDMDADEQMEPGKPQIIPRANEQRVRKDRNPRPRAIVVTCPRNKNIVLLGGDEQYRMPLPTYLDAIRHAKRPTATYMVTALLRRYLPPTTLARLCVNERQLQNTIGGQLVDDELLEALKKQGCMQFPHTNIAERELMLRIEDVTRDVRRKIKLKKSMASSISKQRASTGSTPISMVTPQRSSIGSMSVTTKSRSSRFSTETLLTDEGSGRILRLADASPEASGDNHYDENPQALPMFS